MWIGLTFLVDIEFLLVIAIVECCLIEFCLQLDIAYDKFIRTTDAKHEAIVKEFYSRVLANGDIYRADYEGLYCVNCEEYKVPSYATLYFLFALL